jgi:membrane-bound acyltransferase YfiQ involved in biofilm formation
MLNRLQLLGFSIFFKKYIQKGWVGVIQNYFIAILITMLTIAECRKVLGKNYEKYTDQQIELLRNWLYKIVKMEKKRIDENKAK